MEWISVKERLPKIPEDAPSYLKHIRVIGAWGNSPNNVAEVEFVVELVRGKEIERFKYNGRICPFAITHWMPLPEPPKS